ncbi:carbohydrate esterase family 15 [Pyrenophora seminiperda CCB06]|uniref:(4-O-methyl)-D-glucuronate--lignin esterase n=1 Tax=Pyrenophora seminiperda CCB06 TaxID=1302712 RepID=A0A3M7M958_9PLEO|nr:carbohydrate esterase family 15 [Pyrenophora seminiperda CCB06]
MRYSTIIPLLATTVLSAPVIEQRQGATCTVPTTFPATINAKLPNPFKFFDGRAVTTKADFACKNKEVSAALQAQELGDFPKKPSTVTASLSGSSLSVTSTEGGKSVTFSVSIKKLSGNGPFPAIIAYGAPSIPIPSSVATITFNNDDIAQQQSSSSRGKGKFYDLYGKNIQTSSEIVGENVWFSTRFNPFSTKSSTLATDHHQLAGMVAPRGLIVIENEIDWLGPVATTACMKAARLIYKSLGAPDNMGFTGSGNHNHCSFPSNQQADLTAYITKFLLNQTANTANIERGPSGADAATYIDWSAPTLT